MTNDTPRTAKLLTAIFDREGEVSSYHAPEEWVTLCRELERELTMMSKLCASERQAKVERGEMLVAAEAYIIDIRDRAARLANGAETEAVLKPAREIIILCERALALHNPPAQVNPARDNKPAPQPGRTFA